MKAIITKVKSADASRPFCYLVGIDYGNGVIKEKVLLRVFWTQSTARKHRNNLQDNINAGAIR